MPDTGWKPHYFVNYTGSAVRLTIPFGALEREARMSPEEHARLIARNRERYAVSPAQARPAAAEPERTPSAAATAADAQPAAAPQASANQEDWRS